MFGLSHNIPTNRGEDRANKRGQKISETTRQEDSCSYCCEARRFRSQRIHDLCEYRLEHRRCCTRYVASFGCDRSSELLVRLLIHRSPRLEAALYSESGYPGYIRKRRRTGKVADDLRWFCSLMLPQPNVVVGTYGEAEGCNLRDWRIR